jgi:hypothetical protein
LRGLGVVRQPGGAPTVRRSPHGTAPARGRPMPVVDHGALGPSPPPGEAWKALLRAGAWPPRVHRATPIVGRRRRGDAVPAPSRSCSRPTPRSVALARGVVPPRSQCPPERCRSGHGAGHMQLVDVGHHRVVQEARLSTGVRRGVLLHELPPNKGLGSTCLEGEVGEVVGGKPKMLLCWVWPQHADDRLVREASDEIFTSRIPPSGRWDEVAGRRYAQRWTPPARCR